MLARHADETETLTTHAVYSPFTIEAHKRRAGLTAARETLEEQMERNEITEGVYLERMNALRDAYNHAPDNNVLSPRTEVLRVQPLPQSEWHFPATNTGPLGIRGPLDETDSIWFNGNRSALSDRSWAHMVNDEPPNNEIPDAD